MYRCSSLAPPLPSASHSLRLLAAGLSDANIPCPATLPLFLPQVDRLERAIHLMAPSIKHIDLETHTGRRYKKSHQFHAPGTPEYAPQAEAVMDTAWHQRAATGGESGGDEEREGGEPSSPRPPI